MHHLAIQYIPNPEADVLNEFQRRTSFFQMHAQHPTKMQPTAGVAVNVRPLSSLPTKVNMFEKKKKFYLLLFTLFKKYTTYILLCSILHLAFSVAHFRFRLQQVDYYFCDHFSRTSKVTTAAILVCTIFSFFFEKRRITK